MFYWWLKILISFNLALLHSADVLAGSVDKILKNSKTREKSYYKRLKQKRRAQVARSKGASQHKNLRTKKYAAYHKLRNEFEREKTKFNYKNYIAFSKEKRSLMKKRAKLRSKHARERKRLERLHRRYIRLKKKTEYGLEDVP